MDLYQKTYDLVRQIPSGKISTYGTVARALGDVRAARAVGRMMNQNPNADTMPCFRIVYSDGSIGGFGLGVDNKIRRLEEDGIKVSDGRIHDFDSIFFDTFDTSYPLKQLRAQQIEMREKVDTTDQYQTIETVAGFDVAYPENDFDDCCCAGVIFDYKTKEIIEEQTLFAPVRIPYIPTYLAFREAPLIEALVEKMNTPPSILMVDGNGILHPYHCGIACQVGINTGYPCIGVAKGLLCGSIHDQVIDVDGSPVGFSLFAHAQVKKPVYVSPGHHISLESAKTIATHFARLKIPEPLRAAHNLATQTLKNE